MMDPAKSFDLQLLLNIATKLLNVDFSKNSAVLHPIGKVPQFVPFPFPPAIGNKLMKTPLVKSKNLKKIGNGDGDQVILKQMF